MNVVKTVNCVNYKFSKERWLAGSDFQVTLGDADINSSGLRRRGRPVVSLHQLRSQTRMIGHMADSIINSLHTRYVNKQRTSTAVPVTCNV